MAATGEIGHEDWQTLKAHLEECATCRAVFADVGPKGRLGEGSIALANKLRIASNPRHDSAPDGVTYLIFPGSALRTRGAITAARINSAGARLYRAWSQQRDCELPAP